MIRARQWLIPLFCLALMAFPALSQTDTASTATAPEAKEYRLRIGVRSQARPFSYKSDTLRDVITDAAPGLLAKKHYTGYIARICDEVLNQMLLETHSDRPLIADDIDVIDLDLLRAKPNPAVSRFEFLRPTDPKTAPVIDILCDPATITNDRRLGLIISAPVYLTGISYIQRRATSGRRNFGEDYFCPQFNADGTAPVFLFGLVGNTTASTHGIRKLIDAEEIPQARDVLINYLKPDSPRCQGGAATLAYNQDVDFKGGLRFFRSHDLAAEAFCNGEIDYYIGDREIIMAHANIHPGCDFQGGDETYTMDRYAIYGRMDYDAAHPDRAMLVAQFFEILSQKLVGHPSILDKAFDDTFHPSKPTRSLEWFFRAVRGAP